MRSILAFLALALVGCVTNPAVTITTPDGTKTKFSTGTNLLSEVDEQVSEVEAPGGYHIRHMVKRQDATRVAIAGVQAAGASLLSYIGYLNNLASQVTERMLNGEITLRQGQALLAEIEQAKIAAGVTEATTLNPNIDLPIRQ